MDFRLGADVLQQDGERLGTLRRMIYYPIGQQLTAMTVEHAGFDGRELIVPMDAVADADGLDVYVRLSHDEFDALDDFMVTHNVAPPLDPNTEGIELEEEPIDVPDVPAVGAATGIETIAYTPVLEEATHIPSGDVVLDGSTVVWATDGEIGNLHRVICDDQEYGLRALIIERGFVFTHDAEVPSEWVEAVRSETIVLNVDKATVRSSEER